MNRLGYSIKRLCDLRGITQLQLGAQVGLSEPAVSKIVNGLVKPRPITLTKLIQVLCHTNDEYQNIIACYEGGAEKLKEIPEFLEWKPNPQEEAARARRYIQVKAESIRFSNAVEEKLRETGLAYQRNAFANDLVADFVVSGPSGKVAIECKYNIDRDWDRTMATVRLLEEQIKCDQVLIVVPYENDLTKSAKEQIQKSKGEIAKLETLSSFLK